MPVLKTNKNGVWQDVANAFTHAHTVSDIADLPASLVDDVEALKDKVGANSVAYQVSTAIEANTYQHPYTHPASMITGLSDVATSGSYNDLTDLPTIPSSYNDLEDLPTIPSIDGLATEDYVDEQIASIGGRVEQVQADWTETDATSPAFIKNKPNISVGGSSGVSWDAITDKPFHTIDGVEMLDNDRISILDYTPAVANEILPSTSIQDFQYNSDFGGYAASGAGYTLVVGEEYIVTWDGVDYKCVAQETSVVIPGSVSVGNCATVSDMFIGNNEPFIIAAIPEADANYLSLTDTTSGNSHTVRIYQPVSEESYKIKPEYLPKDFGNAGNEEPTSVSWDNITDKPFEATEVVLFEHSGQFSESNRRLIIEDTSDVTLTVGDTYKVIWNGVEYVSECFFSDGLPALGNTVGNSSDETPFIIGRDKSGMMLGGKPGWIIVEIISDSLNCDVTVVDNQTKYLDNKWLEFMDVQGSKPVIKSEYLPDSIGGQSKLVVLEEQEFSGFAYEEEVANYAIFTTWPFALTGGASYIVVWDGEEYEVTAIDVGSGAILLGNGSLLGLPENDEPFLIMTSSDGTVAICAIGSESESHTIGISQFVDTPSLPPVTAADNGKILEVVNGVWSAVAIADSSVKTYIDEYLSAALEGDY